MWSISEPTAHFYADLATVVTAGIAALAAVFTLGIYYGQRLADLKSFAKNMVREITLLEFENPKFADPKLAAVDFSKKTFDGSLEYFAKYEWFVDLMLWADEEILRIMSGDKRWRRYVRNNLERHREYLASGLYGDFEDYFGKQLCLVIRETIHDTKARQPVAVQKQVAA